MTELHRPAVSGNWLEQTQRRALERFHAVGLPTTRLEEWRHASLLPVAAMLTEENKT